MADLVGCVKEIGKCILTQCIQPPAKRHIDYWWCFDDNIQGLRDGVRDLDRETFDLNKKIEDARLRIEKLRPGVEEWLNLASDKLVEGRRILQDDNIPKAWNVTSRYSMGKRAKKTAEEIAEVRNNGNFNRISDPASPPSTRFSSHRSTMDFESRKHIEEAIIQYLRSSSVSMVGIYGMGGIGKTTMAERIGKKLKEENLFDEVVKVTVSQTIDMPKIQNEIAELLGLKFDVNSLSARADNLRARLMDTKRKIVIFDDVWESLKFEDLGIPFDIDYEKCKVLLTSRSKDSCKGIKNKKVFKLETLEEEEAWSLFREKAGDCVEDLVLNPVAKAIVEECKGLPIALVTVGLVLQDETDKHIWTYSLSKLKEAKPTDLPKEIMTHVYQSLELSYEKLETDVEKMFFLMCCLFPEDYDIPIQQLTWYSMGLKLFDDISVEAATNRTHALVGKLKDRFLLIDGYDKLHAKMHDVVRDVAIYIGSKEKNGLLKSLHRTSIENSSDVNCNWISVDISNERMEVPLVSLFPKLQLLIFLKSRWSSNELSDISFEGMKDLNVLSFERASFGSLPPNLGSLEKLQTLCLFDCQVKNISVIGKLTSLKILSCSGCEYITELPAEIGSLSGLRLLELSHCNLLQRIPFGVISSLLRLEELKMRRSFSRWEAEENGKERRNASLTELECLPNLSCLEIEIDDCTLSAQEICLSLNLVKYYIRIGSIDFNVSEMRYCEKLMILKLSSDIGTVGKWIQKGVRNTEWLHLEGDSCGSNNFNIAEIENLRYLIVKKCSTLTKLVETKDCKFHNLKSIRIESCPKLRSLFSVSTVGRCILQLEILWIENCESMEQVFWNEIRDDNTDGCFEFSKLKELRLRNLPKLTAFCQGLENIIIKFPNLTFMWIEGLPKLNSLSPLNSETVVWHDQNTSSLHFVCNPKVEIGRLKELLVGHLGDNIRTMWCHQIPNNAFNNLERLCIEFMNGIRSLMSTSIAKNLVSLKDLLICNCREMVEVIERDDDDDKQVAESLSLGGYGSNNINLARRFLLQLEVLDIRRCESIEQVFWNEGTYDKTDGCIEFPKLKKLKLENLPNLTAFCQGLENIIFKFPNLKEMKIGGLPKLNSLSPLNSETLVCHDHTTSLHFVCNPKVEMGGLKEIGYLRDNIRNIWCHQIPNNFFNNLQRLSIHYIHGIRSLMSTSIAKNLVSLEHLIIYDSKEMVEIIERDDDNKQVVNINCLFPNLIYLGIGDLPKLIWFWPWNHALELPLLKQVRISNCPMMETFTLGSINIPNISVVEVNNQEMEDHKDLNDVLHHIWRTESKQAKMKILMRKGTGSRMKIRTRMGMKKRTRMTKITS